MTALSAEAGGLCGDKKKMLTILLLLLLVLASAHQGISDAKMVKSLNGRRLLSTAITASASMSGDSNEDIGPDPRRLQLQCIYCGG